MSTAQLALPDVPVKGKKYGKAQEDFIKQIRSAVTSQANFFQHRDWRCIKAIGGTSTSLASEDGLTVDSYYVKPLAVWVPHLLFPDHLPKCPHCKECKDIDISQSRWVDSPMILFGRNNHRYLDTFLYYCSSCNKRFNGYNKQSMQLDSEKYTGFFNFYLGGKGYAVDGELYSFIINAASRQDTAYIHEQCQRTVADGYFTAFNSFLHAVERDQICEEVDSSLVHPHDKKQVRIDALFQPVDRTKVSEAEEKRGRTIRNLKDDIRRLQLELTSAQMFYTDGDIWFQNLIDLKKNKNAIDPPLKGMGLDKLTKLMRHNVHSAKQLVEWDGVSWAVMCSNHSARNRWNNQLASWKAKCRFDLEQRKLKVTEAEKNLAHKRNELLLEEVMKDAAEDPMGVCVEAPEPEGEETATGLKELPKKLPMFSTMDDPTGYNARTISKYRIDSIVINEFGLRKGLQGAKMKGLLACVLKIDFNYKLASKIRVWKGPGDSFCPYLLTCCDLGHTTDPKTRFGL